MRWMKDWNLKVLHHHQTPLENKKKREREKEKEKQENDRSRVIEWFIRRRQPPQSKKKKRKRKRKNQYFTHTLFRILQSHSLGIPNRVPRPPRRTQSITLNTTQHRQRIHRKRKRAHKATLAWNQRPIHLIITTAASAPEGQIVFKRLQRVRR